MVYTFRARLAGKSDLWVELFNSKTIFHLNRSLDDKYPDCQVTYFLSEDLLNGFSTSKLSVIRDSLTDSEKMVFKKWSQSCIYFITWYILFIREKFLSTLEEYYGTAANRKLQNSSYKEAIQYLGAIRHRVKVAG